MPSPSEVKSTLERRLSATLSRIARQLISIPYPPASPPGQPPHMRTGNLRRGLVARVDVDVDEDFNVQIRNAIIMAPGVPYFRFVNDGTSKMNARPFVEPARQQFFQEANRIIRRILRNML